MTFDRLRTLNICRNYLLASDVVAFLLAYLLGGFVFYLMREETLNVLGLKFVNLFFSWSIYFHIMIPFAVLRFWYAGHYTRRKPFWDELKDIIQVVLLLFVAEGTILFLTEVFVFTFVVGGVLSSLYLFSCLQCVSWSRKLSWLPVNGSLTRLLIGTGQNALDAIAALQSEKLLGFSVQGMFSLDDQISAKTQILQVNDQKIPVHPFGDDPVRSIRRFGEPNIVFAMESGGIRTHLDMIEDLHRNFSDIYIVPALRGLPLYGMEINTFFRHEVLLLRVRNILARRMPRLLKRSFDILLAGLLMGSLSPLLLFLAWQIRRDGGSVLYAHKRVGRNGRLFDCLKFRSMAIDADKVLDHLLENDAELRKEWDTDHKLKNDPRVTRIGEFLRRNSLDELPQLWNVIRGEMSLIGPRPIVTDEIVRYGKDIRYYKSVRPGMTGLWQISGRNDTDYSNRVYLDSWYVKNWSLWSDIVIMLKTVNVVLSKRGAY